LGTPIRRCRCPGDNINITRDGISVNDARYSSGIVTPSRLNPEMVGEFKLILTPVDAEMGRGAGQVQVMTKSGGNEYHGSAVWSLINTALDANEWEYNAPAPTRCGKRQPVHDQRRRPDHQEQDLLLRVLDHNIPRKRESVFFKRADAMREERHLPVLAGWIPAMPMI